MAEVLKKNNIFPDLILTSSAERAKIFAETLADNLNYNREKIVITRDFYSAEAPELFSFFKTLGNSYSKVFFIGHNPEITYLANYMSDQDIDNIPTSGIFGLRYEIDKWEDLDSSSAELICFYYPKLFNT